MENSALIPILSGQVKRIEIDLTRAQQVAMSHGELYEYEQLFRAAFDHGLWVTHWQDPAFGVTHYVISSEPTNADSNQM